MLSQFLGGLPPAIFLFLTGLTFAFLMDSQERKGLGNWERVKGALKRSRYLFLLAVLFRLQLYIFGFPTSPAGELLRVDILNCMGFAMLLLAPMAVFSTAERIRLCSVLGLVIAFLAPVVSAIDVSRFPALLSSYVVPSYSAFGFFPWAGVPGVRNGRRQRDPDRYLRPTRKNDAMDAWHRADRHCRRALPVESAIFSLSQGGLLAR